jgi:nitroimidazol reductase NimA-like FMN-containing flavoprotein (pyridoxamine 5'-phosphate oxidase superfamily)
MGQEGGDTMTDRDPVKTTNLDRYGFAELPWSRPHDILAGMVPTADVPWILGTTRPDGRPHAAGLGAVWHDGDLYFTSGPATRKSRNLAVNAAATISTRVEGIDLVFEGEATRVADHATLDTLVKKFNDGGWPATVEGDAFTAPFSAPSAGPPPWPLYRFRFDVVYGVATAEPYGATKWRFAE